MGITLSIQVDSYVAAQATARPPLPQYLFFYGLYAAMRDRELSGGKVTAHSKSRGAE